MSHDQKPARVRVVNAARPPATAGSTGTASAVGGDAGAAGAGADATSAKPAGGAGASLLVGGLFLVAAAIGGACAALFLP